MRRFTTALLLTLATLASCSSDDPAFEIAAAIDDAAPGDIIALRSDGEVVEYIHRRAGEIRSVHSRADANDGPLLIAAVVVSTEGEQRGLLGHTVINGRRYAAWTDPDSFDLVVGEITSGALDRIVWSGTGTQATAIGGHLDTRADLIVLGLGSLTDWAKDHGSGALVTLDPDGEADQEPIVISDGWNNPFAFTVVDDDIWVADNSPDGSDLPVEERTPERLGWGGRADPVLTDLPLPQRAASATVQLPDGRFGVCGFLDGEMWAYEVGPDDTIERAGTIGPCLTGATVLSDGAIATASTDDDGNVAIFVRSAA